LPLAQLLDLDSLTGGSKVINLHIMLSASTCDDLLLMLPVLAPDDSNWIPWKLRMETFLEATGLWEHLDHSTPPPSKPRPPAQDANEDEVEGYEKEYKKYKEWKRADAEVRYYIISTIPEPLFFRAINRSHPKTSGKRYALTKNTK
jgi:hypothetical protein